MAVVEIKLDQLKIHPNNVRKEYDGIEELAQSIRENGIMQNLTVVPELKYWEEQQKKNPTKEVKAAIEGCKGKDTYLVVIGNRRLTAARQAGIETAPCVIIEDMSDKDQVATMLTENMNRKDLKIYEEAAAIQMCFADYGFQMEEMEQKTGLSKTTINHRLNVAKLDESALKKKAQDEEFQLSLTDLYALEKVEDVKTRNRILKEARDSRDLANKARQAAREEKQKKNEKEIIDLCKKKGIKPAPKEADNEFYSGKWEKLASYSLDDKVPKQLKIKSNGERYDKNGILIKPGSNKGESEELFYITRYSVLYIISRTKKTKKEPTKQEIKEKEKKKHQREIKAKYKAMFADMGDFVRSILDGKTAMAKDKEDLDQRIWKFMIRDSSWIGMNDVTQAILGKDLYASGITQEERNAAEEKAKSLSVICQKLAVAYWKMKDLNIVEWNGTYSKTAGEKLDMFYDILTLFGYSWADDDSARIASGEHELYE